MVALNMTADVGALTMTGESRFPRRDAPLGC